MIERQLNPEPMTFSCKGDTLRRLMGRISSAGIMPVHLVSYQDFKKKDEWKTLLSALPLPLIVRSSHSSEDAAEVSLAGKFDSVLNVKCELSLFQALETVFRSYGGQLGDNELALVQPQLTDVTHNGVLFTRDPDTGADYYVIADDVSGATDNVTGGQEGLVTTHFLVKGAQSSNPLIVSLIALADELCELFDNDALDIEYAVDNSGALWLLQVRPMTIKTRGQLDLNPTLELVRDKLQLGMAPHPYLFGSSTIYGVMPDWNPAEIIGLYPKPLALSLYKELITNSTWAYQRDNYGYRNLRSFPLMQDFFGLPYIDVRLSFNSFLPRDISPALGHKLVDYYLACLRDNPTQHDRVEFDIVLSCYTPAIDEKLTELLNAGFSEWECSEVSSLLRRLTNHIIDPRTGLWIQDLHRIERLKERHAIVTREIKDPLQRVYWLLEDCKRYGTLPFAGLARAAFIAVQLLQSLQKTGCFTSEDYQAFLGSLNTVSSSLSQDLQQLDKESFLKEYGHLRPGTYDICSPRYDAEPERYFRFGEKAQMTDAEPAFKLNEVQTHKLNQLLRQHGLNHSAESLLHFIKAAIEGREYAKFVFSRNLSDALESLAQWGASLGLEREDMAYLDVAKVYQLVTGCGDHQTLVSQNILEGKRQFARSRLIRLPPLITRPEQVFEFSLGDTEPNFITAKVTVAPVVVYPTEQSIEGKIVLISSADPGFDWIFSHKVAGFITAFGGCNSHMAIRAAELGIPAVIGAGEQKYAQWCRAGVLELNCANKLVRVLS
ncbi:hypothetical protein KJI95_10390 [Shewanella sp. JM162201]|uniref:Phosphoenolpyruvate synthase n=1 Tax=Shewanella jiangmenensis TaxID=2837387 RepID=A0ABS5V5N6_9GAMM|nr:PEP/pyruvate-binding domain-containing protein [Shewanella jiangmenensis]MBT1444931.1 hypothetical protein [Shewanella jiangmenensis]